MENVISVPKYANRSATTLSFGWDTAIVLIFLAADLAHGTASFGFDAILSLVTIAAFIVLPYFLPFAGDKPEFSGWLLRRVLIAIIAFAGGLCFQRVTEVILMDSLRFLPMTLLILSGILCAGTQIRGIIGVRLAS